MNHHEAPSRQFGQRTQPNTVIISTNGKIREYKVHVGILMVVSALAVMFFAGYVGATAYLVFRDDLMTASLVRQARIKHEYEDRISALRIKVDHITSRQLLDQQAVESRVAELMKQQEVLTGQNGALNGLIKRARDQGLGLEDPVNSTQSSQKSDSITTGSISLDSTLNFADASSFLRGTLDQNGVNSGADKNVQIAKTFVAANSSNQEDIFGNVHDQIKQISQSQRSTIIALHNEIQDKAIKLTSVFDQLNVPLQSSMTKSIGGPFIADEAVAFEDLTTNFSSALGSYETLKKKIDTLPVKKPLTSAKISSSYGHRVDPFYKKRAFHSGMDFRARSGTKVMATGSGKVIKAERNGGYGLMVEIDHGNGIKTRYAHLSRIHVKVGAKVDPSTVIGRVGSTGRSTGPHLHYEVRRGEKSTNPARFIKAGKKLKALL